MSNGTCLQQCYLLMMRVVQLPSAQVPLQRVVRWESLLTAFSGLCFFATVSQASIPCAALVTRHVSPSLDVSLAGL